LISCYVHLPSVLSPITLILKGSSERWTTRKVKANTGSKKLKIK